MPSISGRGVLPVVGSEAQAAGCQLLKDTGRKKSHPHSWSACM